MTDPLFDLLRSESVTQEQRDSFIQDIKTENISSEKLVKGITKREIYIEALLKNNIVATKEEALELTKDMGQEKYIPSAAVVEWRIPKDGRLISDAAKELAVPLRGTFYYHVETKNVVTTGLIQHDKQNINGFIPILPTSFITMIEDFVIPLYYIKDKETEEYIAKHKSITKGQAETILSSPQFINNIQPISRLFTVPLPILYHDKIVFPVEGYDIRFSSWFVKDAPKIKEDMTLEQSKEIINSIYDEFCFENPQDKVNAIAALLTPFVRELYSHRGTRTPIIIYLANRERAGKDYCAGIPSIVYEGVALEETPISTEEKGSGHEDEFRKKILSILMRGGRRYHSSNNKGMINNSVLESLATNSVFSDRLLGQNKTLEFTNEIDISLSGNTGLKVTPDLANKSIFVNLFLDIEDANTRQFKRTDLHGWLKSNRGIVLSALYTLVKNWVDKGKPKGTLPFTSYPEWSSIVGGILESANIGNPCLKLKDSLSGGLDARSEQMKILFEEISKEKQEQWTTQEIRHWIQNHSDLGIFPYLDLNDRGGQTTFGNNILLFAGRIFSNIRMVCHNPTDRGARRKYSFKQIGNLGNLWQPYEKKESIQNKDVVTGNLGNLGNLSNYNEYKNNIDYIYGMEKDTNVTKVAKIDEETSERIILKLFKEKEEILADDLNLSVLKQLAFKGDVFEVRSGVYRLLE